MTPLGLLIEQRMNQLGLSKHETARRCGITRYGLSKIMGQDGIRVQYATRRKIAHGLALPLHEVERAAQATVSGGTYLEDLTVREVGDVFVSALADAPDEEVEEAVALMRAELTRIRAERQRQRRRQQPPAGRRAPNAR